jgi:tetratricopeptide (TPR) repeat protein
LWQQVSSDHRLDSPISKAKALEDGGTRCKDEVMFSVRLSNLYIQGNNLARAEEVVNAALRERPRNPELRGQRAEIEFRKGNETFAEREAEQLVQTYPNYTPPYLILSQIATNRRQWQTALDLDRRVYEINKSPLMLLTMTGSLHQLGRHEEAVATAYQALKDDPSLVGRRAGINEAIYSLAALGRFDEAAQLVKRRIAADPNWRQDPTFLSAAKRLRVVER